MGTEVKPLDNGVLSKLEEEIKSSKETANKIRGEWDHDNVKACLTLDIDEMIRAAKPSSTGASKGFMVDLSGTLIQVKRGDKYYNLRLGSARGGAWVTWDVLPAEAPKAKHA